MGAERRITITLESDLDAFVQDEVGRGDFSSGSDYLHQMLRQRFEQDRERRRQELGAALNRGIADADAGRVKTVDATFDGLRSALGLDQSGI